jgi:hypothetical protein
MKDFETLFASWRKQLKDGALGPLLIAQDVVAASEDWDPKEHDGLTYSGALRRALGEGRDMGFFRSRSQAVKMLGGMRVAHMLDHQAAVWLTRKAQDSKLSLAIREAADAYNRNHRCPLTKKQVITATRSVFGVRVKTRVHEGCALCDSKDKMIEELSVKLRLTEQEMDRASRVIEP